MYGLCCWSPRGVPLGGSVEILFLGLYLWWVSGNGPPRSTSNTRRSAFRCLTLSRAQWAWGLFVALLFAATIHTAIVFVFRLVPFPAEAFRRGYDISIVPSVPLRW